MGLRLANFDFYSITVIVQLKKRNILDHILQIVSDTSKFQRRWMIHLQKNIEIPLIRDILETSSKTPFFIHITQNLFKNT